MSQLVRIQSVKIEGSVYIGKVQDLDTWSTNPDHILNWLCDSWRFRFNQFRAWRTNYDDYLGQNRYGTAERPGDLDSQARKDFPHIAGLPNYILSTARRQERESWIGALRRIKSDGKGKTPGFKSSKGHQHFVMHGSISGYVAVTKLSKRRSEIRITGRNPAGLHGTHGPYWCVRVRFRAGQEIRPYTSVRVNWSSGTMSFVNAPLPIERNDTGSLIGIDLGVTRTVATSNDEFHDIPKASQAESDRYKALQRKLARQNRVNKAEGRIHASGRSSITRDKLKRISSTQSMRRRDWVDKVTTKLIRDSDVIVMEDLSPIRMSKKGKGKAGLNRGIRESCWGLFQSRLSYKAVLANVSLVWVNPAYTSQTCSQCAHVSRDNRESQAVFKCTLCGHTENADINAAKNILDRGLATFGAGYALGRGAEIRPESLSQDTFTGASFEPSTIVDQVA